MSESHRLDLKLKLLSYMRMIILNVKKMWKLLDLSVFAPIKHD